LGLQYMGKHIGNPLRNMPTFCIVSVSLFAFFSLFAGPPEMRPLFGQTPKTCLETQSKYAISPGGGFRMTNYKAKRTSKRNSPRKPARLAGFGHFSGKPPFWHFRSPFGTVWDRLGGLRGARFGTFGSPFSQISRFPGSI